VTSKGESPPPRVPATSEGPVNAFGMQKAHLNVGSSQNPPPPVFSQKSVQVIENKEKECEKERKEISRGGKLLKTGNLPPRPGRGRQEHRGHRDGEGIDGECRRGDTPGVLYGCENKGVAGKGICKVMKTKEQWPLEDRGKRVARGSSTRHPCGDGKYAQCAENGGDIYVTWRI
jgi:hypothetical protein